jgi:hypothetical protein
MKFLDYYGLHIVLEGARGGVVAKALRYKPAGGGFDSRWCHWNFSINPAGRTMALRSTQPLTEVSKGKGKAVSTVTGLE